LPALTSSFPAETEAISIVPDDVLYGVPFAAAPVNGKMMIDEWAVSSAGGWLPVSHGSTADSLLLTAVPEPGPAFERLPKAVEEVAAAVRTTGAPSAAQRIAVRAAGVAEELPRAGIWHAACHGVSQPKEPGASGIVLESGEILRLRDIAALDARRLKLAFLASCWSADNFQFPGRIVVSLPQALQLAGAETVIGSLWQVLDEVAPAFVGAVYHALQGGAPRDQALRHAMLRCRQEEDGTTRPLADWAGFVLFGNTARLRMIWS
jgi:CHAT domain-containing protein